MLEPYQVAGLEALKARTGTTPSEQIRRIIDRSLFSEAALTHIREHVKEAARSGVVLEDLEALSELNDRAGKYAKAKLIKKAKKVREER